jgi:hypothetical protein
VSSGFEVLRGALRVGNITFAPSIHGRAAFALEVRRLFLSESFDCVAVELPPSLEDAVVAATEQLPRVEVVLYREASGGAVYVPCDPCDSIIEAVRLGHREQRCALEFIDAEVGQLEVETGPLPDEYAVLKIGLPRYYEAVAPHVEEAEAGSQDAERELVMAARLRKLAARHRSVLFVCGLRHAAPIERLLRGEATEAPSPGIPPFEVKRHVVHRDSLYHVLGELPQHTWLYEQVRHSITLEEYEPIFGLKQLLLAARARTDAHFKDELHRVSPQSLQRMLTYMRNLCVLGGYLTPSLYEIAVAAKGIGGDAFAIKLIELARHFGPPEDLEEEAEEELKEGSGEAAEEEPEATQNEPGDDDAPPWLDAGASPFARSLFGLSGDDGDDAEEGGDEAAERDDGLRMTSEQARLDGNLEALKRRLPGPPKFWKKLKLEKPPPTKLKKSWKKAWDESRSVSWPPEDAIVESFAGYVRKRALSMTQLSLARSEEFSSSIMDGLDIKETLRQHHLDKLYVKVEPRVTGQVGAVVIIFEEEAPDSDRFPWKITWYAEHENESTLSFYATRFQDHIVGPGIARALYGGALFIYPPKSIPDVWDDPSLHRARTSMERLVFGAARHADDRYIAYVAPSRPTARMRSFCELHGRKLIYLPLSSFSRQTLWKLRSFHVLNGREVRSWAARFVR